MKVVTEVMELFGMAGRAAYFGEPVSQEEHALQCAHLADQQGADDSLVVAALLFYSQPRIEGQGKADLKKENQQLKTTIAERDKTIAKLHVIRDNKYVYSTEPKTAEVKLRYTDMDAPSGKTSYYYVRLEQADGNLAWASPMWITYKP